MGIRVAALLAFLLLVCGCSAQTTSSDCNSQLAVLVPCLSYLQGTGNDPPSTCCTGFNAVATNNVTCICVLATQGLGSGSGAGVNTTRAFELPSKCKSNVDPASVCNLSLPPPPGSAPTPESGAGSNGNDGNAATSLMGPLSLLLAFASTALLC